LNYTRVSSEFKPTLAAKKPPGSSAVAMSWCAV